LQHDTSGAYENFLKQFLTKTPDEAKVGMQLALLVVDQGNQETRMLAEQGLLPARGQPMMMNPQNPTMMNRFSNIQVPQTPLIVQ